METMVVSVHDTDVLLLPLAHFDNMVCTCLYMKAGTSKALEYITVHAIRWMLAANQMDTLIASMLSLAVTVYPSLVVMARKQPGRSFRNITLTWPALGRVSH